MQKTIKEIFAKKLMCKNLSEDEKQRLKITTQSNEEFDDLIPMEIIQEIKEISKTKFNLKNNIKNILVPTERGGINFSG
ncbi:MAG: hypothetical protein ACRC4T_16540, partial [Cetobacterium sp.]